jgi:hypothetical protein
VVGELPYKQLANHVYGLIVPYFPGRAREIGSADGP